MQPIFPNPYFLAGSVIFISAAIFLVDLRVPLAVAVGVLYIVSVFVASRLGDVKPMIWTAAVCSGLIAVESVLSPQNAVLWQVLINGALALLVIWSAVIFLAYRKQAEVLLLETKERLANAF